MIRELDLDLVCLQEVVGQYPDQTKGSQFEYLADQVWHHFAYGKNAITSNGHHGNAILSLFPFISQENINISNHRYERRGILYGVIETEKSMPPLHVMTVHLDLTNWGRRKQLNKICDLIVNRIPVNEPFILCGDFNDWQEEVSDFLFKKLGLIDAYLNHRGRQAKTFPAIFPVFKLDRFYLRNIEVLDIRRMDNPMWSDLSDHLALVAELRFVQK